MRPNSPRLASPAEHRLAAAEAVEFIHVGAAEVVLRSDVGVDDVISARVDRRFDRVAATTNSGTRRVAHEMMVEARTIAGKLGVRFANDVEKRIDGGAAVGAHKTSMLQDLERGRPLELDALVTAVQELGRITGTPTPTIDTVLALIKLRAVAPQR